jgi:hypothetical protein
MSKAERKLTQCNFLFLTRRPWKTLSLPTWEVIGKVSQFIELSWFVGHPFTCYSFFHLYVRQNVWLNLLAAQSNINLYIILVILSAMTEKDLCIISWKHWMSFAPSVTGFRLWVFWQMIFAFWKLFEGIDVFLIFIVMPSVFLLWFS